MWGKLGIPSPEKKNAYFNLPTIFSYNLSGFTTHYSPPRTVSINSGVKHLGFLKPTVWAPFPVPALWGQGALVLPPTLGGGRGVPGKRGLGLPLHDPSLPSKVQPGGAVWWGRRGSPGERSPRPGFPGAGVSPDNEEDDAQRLRGDGEDVEGERRPEGNEGAAEEHGRRHGDRGRRPLACGDATCARRGRLDAGLVRTLRGGRGRGAAGGGALAWAGPRRGRGGAHGGGARGGAGRGHGGAPRRALSSTWIRGTPGRSCSSWSRGGVSWRI